MPKDKDKDKGSREANLGSSDAAFTNMAKDLQQKFNGLDPVKTNALLISFFGEKAAKKINKTKIQIAFDAKAREFIIYYKSSSIFGIKPHTLSKEDLDNLEKLSTPRAVAPLTPIAPSAMQSASTSASTSPATSPSVSPRGNASDSVWTASSSTTSTPNVSPTSSPRQMPEAGGIYQSSSAAIRGTKGIPMEYQDKRTLPPITVTPAEKSATSENKMSEAAGNYGSASTLRGKETPTAYQNMPHQPDVKKQARNPGLHYQPFAKKASSQDPKEEEKTPSPTTPRGSLKK